MLRDVRAPDPLVASNNPLGGIPHGRDAISELRATILRGPGRRYHHHGGIDDAATLAAYRRAVARPPS